MKLKIIITEADSRHNIRGKLNNGIQGSKPINKFRHGKKHLHHNHKMELICTRQVNEATP